MPSTLAVRLSGTSIGPDLRAISDKFTFQDPSVAHAVAGWKTRILGASLARSSRSAARISYLHCRFSQNRGSMPKNNPSRSAVVRLPGAGNVALSARSQRVFEIPHVCGRYRCGHAVPKGTLVELDCGV